MFAFSSWRNRETPAEATCRFVSPHPYLRRPSQEVRAGITTARAVATWSGRVLEVAPRLPGMVMMRVASPMAGRSPFTPVGGARFETAGFRCHGVGVCRFWCWTTGGREMGAWFEGIMCFFLLLQFLALESLVML